VTLPSGYRLSTDPGEVDVGVVAAFLHDEAYWSLGRPRSVVEASLAASRTFVILTDRGEMAAFARVVTDGVTSAGSATSSSWPGTGVAASATPSSTPSCPIRTWPR
jgi:hypothetical protein